MVTLDDLHNAINRGIKRAVPGLAACESYPEFTKRLPLPGVFTELSEFEPGDDPGTEQLALIARCEARCVIDPVDDNASLYARNLAVSVGLAVQLSRRWGLRDVGTARIVRIGEDAFRPELDSYAVWVVQWTHVIHIGQSIWTGHGITPTVVSLGDEVITP